MLQQTRVAQGRLIFSLSAAFPTVFDLAEARRGVKLWQGLILSRARNLHKTAQYVAWELAGVFQIITVIY
jgi:A/G-specific adenine glycosylase